MRIERSETARDLAASCATRLLEVCRLAQAGGRIPTVVLTGGSMGAATLTALATHDERDRIDWSRVRFLWGDERWVPAGHDDRNDRLADERLFGAVGVDPALVHRAAGPDSGLTLEEAASGYADVVDRIDRIDVALNGVGPDGHIASLFPGRDDLLRDDHDTPSVLPVRSSPKPPAERVTLSLPSLRRAERVWLVAAGAEKASAVSRLLGDDAPLLPAARARGRTETVLWADRAALSR